MDVMNKGLGSQTAFVQCSPPVTYKVWCRCSNDCNTWVCRIHHVGCHGQGIYSIKFKWLSHNGNVGLNPGHDTCSVGQDTLL